MVNSLFTENECVHVWLLQDLALRCIADSPEARPSFAEILTSMEQLRSNVQAGPGRAFLRDGFATSASAVASKAVSVAATAGPVSDATQSEAAAAPDSVPAAESEPAHEPEPAAPEAKRNAAPDTES